MSDRISIKGKGADLFFDEGPDETSPGHSDQQDASRADAETRASVDVATSANQGSQTPANQSANQPSPAPASDDASEFFRRLTLPPALRKKLRAAYREEHPFHTTIRLSREDTNALRDICYELEARMGLAVNRNDIGRLALRLLLEDYAIRKKESLLVQVLNDKDQF